MNSLGRDSGMICYVMLANIGVMDGSKEKEIIGRLDAVEKVMKI